MKFGSFHSYNIAVHGSMIRVYLLMNVMAILATSVSRLLSGC